MKLEQLIVQYLYTNKKVTIQDIGTFTISPDVVLPFESDKDMMLPAGAISFEYDTRAAQDDDLVSFITQQTRKIRPLAASDLESYSILSKQFLNIGKPLLIEGLGTLQKTQQGNYEFIQGQTINPRLEAAPARMAEKADEEISFRSSRQPDRRASGKKTWFAVLALFFVALAGVSVFYLLNRGEKKTEIVTPVVDITPAPIVAAPKDTAAPVIPDSAKASVTARVANDGYTFKVVIKEYASKDAADKAFARLTRYGHKLILAPIDSVRYKISMPFTTPAADSTRAKDSLALFFKSKTYIDLR